MFSVTRNIFGNAKPLARKGVENSSEVVVFYRAPRVPTPIFKRFGILVGFSSKIGPRTLGLSLTTTQKPGQILYDLLRLYGLIELSYREYLPRFIVHFDN